MFESEKKGVLSQKRFLPSSKQLFFWPMACVPFCTTTKYVNQLSNCHTQLYLTTTKVFNFFFLSIIRFCHRVAKQKTQQNYSFTQKMVQKPKWKYYWEMTKTVADLIIYIFFCQTIMPPISIEQKLTKNAINKQEFILFAKAFIFCRYACLPACIYILSNLLLLN